MEFSIPCDVVARFANVLRLKTPEANEWSRCIRIDHGIAVASNRRIMAVENIGGPGGIVHLIADDALIAQCETEAKYDSVLTIVATPEMQYATCKTTMGYVHPGNCAEWSQSENYLDKWRSVLPVPAAKSVGGMFWETTQIAALGRSSPSGGLVFAELIDVTRPTVIRDAVDPNWFGVFLSSGANRYEPAKLPEWMK